MPEQILKNSLGNTELNVSKLGFGCALYRKGKRHWTLKRAGQVWNAALDAGINFFDTAYDYVDSEERIRSTIESRYEEFYIATKVGCTDTKPYLNESEHVWTRENLYRGIEGSLKRLNRSNVDIIQLHNATVEECRSGDLVPALEDIKREGMTKYIGASTELPDVATLLEWGVFDVMQIPYSALHREHENWITRAGEAGVGIIVRGGVAQGEYSVGRGKHNIWKKFHEAKLDELLGIDESPSSFVLRFTLSHPYVHTVIVGTTKLDHLKENLKTVRQGVLPEELYLEAKRRLDSIGESPTLL